MLKLIFVIITLKITINAPITFNELRLSPKIRKPANKLIIGETYVQVDGKKLFILVVKYTTPMGGLCLWPTFEKDIDSNKLLKRVREQQVNLLSGQIFFSYKYEKNHIRLSYFHMEEVEIIEGVKRLFKVL